MIAGSSSAQSRRRGHAAVSVTRSGRARASVANDSDQPRLAPREEPNPFRDGPYAPCPGILTGSAHRRRHHIKKGEIRHGGTTDRTWAADGDRTSLGGRLTLGAIGTCLRGFHRWKLNWVDLVISRTSRQDRRTCEASWKRAGGVAANRRNDEISRAGFSGRNIIPIERDDYASNVWSRVKSAPSALELFMPWRRRFTVKFRNHDRQRT